MQVCVAFDFSLAFPFLICSDSSRCCRLHISGALHAFFLTLYFILLLMAVLSYIYHSCARTTVGDKMFKDLSTGFGWARRPLISWMGTEMPSTIPVTILYGQVGAGWVRRCNFLSPLCVCVCACACVHAWVCICLHVLGLMGKDRSAGG